MQASFVIVNYNRKEELLITISKTKELISGRDTDYEIVIVDNASHDGSADAVKEKYPDVVIIENKVNMGAPAWNLGFEKACGDYFIILDDDSHMEGGLEESLNYLNNNPTIGILALNITGGNFETSEWDDLSETIGFIGCGAIFRKSLYQRIGGYADWMFLYANEWELGLRCLDAGYKVVYFKNSSVVHRTSKVHRTNKRLRVFTTKNEMGIVYKHFQQDKWKYLLRVWINNIKIIKTEGFMSAYYSFLGGIKFFQTRKELKPSPVSGTSQDLFAKYFWGTQPVFKFITKRFKGVHSQN
jgi:GT2 family glycosyltransferase